MIIFKAIRWKNFLSTGNLFIEMLLNEHTSTLIIGKNGHGKSQFLDAVSFVLFNKPFRNINKNQLVNSITKKQTVVEVEFEIGQNQYKIVRGIRPNVFEVYENGKLLNQDANVKDYQEVLETKILKTNHKTFCQVVILGSANHLHFMQLPAAARRQIIEDLLDLDLFTTMNGIVKTEIASNNEKLSENRYEKKLLEEKLAMTKKHMQELQANNEKLIEEKKARVTETEAVILDIDEKLKGITEKLHELNESIADEEKVLKRKRSLEEVGFKIKQKKKEIENELAFFKDHDDCPTCRQGINEEFKLQRNSDLETNLTEINAGLGKWESEYTSSCLREASILKVRTNISETRIELVTLNTQKESHYAYIRELKKEIAASVAEVKTDNDIELIQASITKADRELAALTDEKNILSVLGTMLKDNGVKAKIIKQYIPVINKLINKYLEEMEFMCLFELDEEFNESIKSRYRDDFSYDSFSEGEKMRINLAILFAWRAIAKMRNSMNTNLLIMDEVFDSSLDNDGSEHFMSIIKYLTPGNNTFIISHKGEEILDKFDKTIRFEKVKNFSRIVE